MTKKVSFVCLVFTLIIVLLVFVGCTKAYISNIVLNETYLEMNVGDEATLTATVDVGMSVDIEWTSSNSTVATVDNGVVTAVSAGATSVKASAQGKVAVCTVVVRGSQYMDPPQILDDRFEFLTFTDYDGMVMGSVLQDSVCTFDFNTEIVAGRDVSYIVCRDIECTQIINSKVVTLQNGYNLFYILKSCGGVDKLYQVNIRQIPVYLIVLNSNGCDAKVTCSDTGEHCGTYPEGQTVTINVERPLGCIFEGWYYGTQLLSTDMEYTFEMPAANLTYTAKFSAESRIANLDFETTATTFRINGFKQGADTRNLTVPEYTTSIADSAFANAAIDAVTWLATDCEAIKGNDTLTNTVFRECSIGDLYFDKDVKRVANYMFRDARIANIRYNGSVADWCQIEFDFNCANPLSFADNWYVGDELVEDLVIPEGVTEIKQCAFDGSKIKSVSFPSSLRSIQGAAFVSCRNLTSIKWSEGITSIGFQAFCYCTELSGRVILPQSLKTLDWGVFGYTKISTILIPRNIQRIGVRLFEGCSTLETLLFDGFYADWLTVKTKIEDDNAVLFVAQLFTSLGQYDNPDGRYWRYEGDGIQLSYFNVKNAN